MTNVNDIARSTIGRNLRALAYSTLIAASVNNAYLKIVVSRLLYPGTIVMTGEAGQGREIVGLELLLKSVTDTRFFLISALVLCMVLLLVVSPACARLRGTRFGTRAWIVPGGIAFGAIVAFMLDQISYPISVGSAWGMVLSGMSAGGFLAFYLTRRLRREA